MSRQNEHYMQRALALARRGEGRTAPNPPVGAVVVRDGAIVGEGYHPGAGQPHAEVFALGEAAELARGADLYVTLEPCCHHGQTAPCTEAVINAGIARVFIGAQDPNPRVAGGGMQQLQRAGIEVTSDVLASECTELIAPFAKHVLTGLPYIVYKAAMTLDGQTATAAGDSKWISCDASREIVHQLRNRVDGIIIGSGTVIADDPRLTTRLKDAGRDAVRIVFDGGLATSPQASVYRQDSTARTILVTADGHRDELLQPYRDGGVELVEVTRTAGGLDLRAALVELGKRNLQHLLLEGGSRLAAAILHAGLLDRMMVFIAPKLLGGGGCGLFAGSGVAEIAAAWRLSSVHTRRIDTDILVEGEVQHVHRSD